MFCARANAELCFGLITRFRGVFAFCFCEAECAVESLVGLALGLDLVAPWGMVCVLV